MSRLDLRKLVRECAALIAVLALVLGPLALSVGRGLGAAEMVAIASGAKPLALCLPGGGADSDSPTAGHDCDHCIPVVATILAAPLALPLPAAAGSNLLASRPATTWRSARGPPARGPPTA